MRNGLTWIDVAQHVGGRGRRKVRADNQLPSWLLHTGIECFHNAIFTRSKDETRSREVVYMVDTLR